MIYMDTFKYFSMFSGIGGFERGILNATEEGKAECVGFSEINKYARSIYKKQFPRHPDFGDATRIKTETIPDFDLLVAGFPCQAFSVAGKQRGFADCRGTLFYEIARVLQNKTPRHFILENVKGLLYHEKGDTISTILEVLDALDYFVEGQILNSKDFGVPQNRERVFLVGHYGGYSGRQVFPITGNNGEITKSKRLRQIGTVGKDSEATRVYNPDGLSKTIKNGGGMGAKTGLYFIPSTKDNNCRCIDANYYKGFNNLKNRSGIAIPVLTPDRLNKRQNGRRFKTDGEPAFTLTSQDKHGIFDGYRIRRLTPLECCRLQGFPDDWTKYGKDNELISDTQRYKCLGNAVTVPVVTEIIKRLYR